MSDIKRMKQLAGMQLNEAKYTNLPDGWSDIRERLSDAIDEAFSDFNEAMDYWDPKEKKDFLKISKELDKASSALDKAFHKIP